jgi:hypothetical protein
MLADAVARLGAGEVADRKSPEGVGAKLGAILTDDSYRRAARAVAGHYVDFDPKRQRAGMLARACELLEKRPRPEVGSAFVGSTFVAPATVLA